MINKKINKKKLNKKTTFKHPKKFLFMFNVWGDGGVESTSLTLAQQLDKKGVQVHFVIISKIYTGFKIPKYIKLHSGAQHDLKHNSQLDFLAELPGVRLLYKQFFAVKLFFLLKKITKKYGKFDLILRYNRLPMPKFMFKNFIDLNNIYTWVHTDDSYLRTSLYKRKLYVINLVTDKILLVSNGMEEFLKQAGVKGKQIKTIYNPFNINKIRKLSMETNVNIPKESYIIHAGRFCLEKRHDRMLKVYKKLKTPCKLVLLTKAEAQLTKLIKDHNLEDRVIVAGFQSNPFPWFKHAKLSVLCSDYEAFGNVIVESLICGCPVVSTDIRSGPNEILIDDLAKWLVPVPVPYDEEKLTDDLANKIDLALNTKINIPEHIINRFDADKITDQYLKLAI